jgi:hypothetical protein
VWLCGGCFRVGLGIGDVWLGGWDGAGMEFGMRDWVEYKLMIGRYDLWR